MAPENSIPPLIGILETSLYVTDLQRSRDFYQDLLGFALVLSSERLVALAVAPGQVLLLFAKGSATHAPHTAHDGSGQLHVAFAIPASALTVWQARLSERGIAIVDQHTWEAGGRSVYFRDPDGHLVELATPGVWSNY